MATTGKKPKTKKKPKVQFLYCLTSPRGRPEGYNNYHMRRCNLEAKAASLSVRSCKLSEPYKRCMWFFYLFFLLGKLCPIPSVLIISICLNSRIWPRIEFWPPSVLMTKRPSYLKISCFSFILELEINNQKLSSFKGQGPEKEGKAQICLPMVLLNNFF